MTAVARVVRTAGPVFPIVFALALVAGAAFGQGADPDPPDPGRLVGGAHFYFCAALQVGKWFFTANLPVFLGMAIAGGLACGFGL